jgi:hypothetical protein
MNEISIILKNNILIPVEEFRVLDRYSSMGRMWTLIQRPSIKSTSIITQRTVEYIFDPEALLIFHIVSQNILAKWDTELTRYLKPNEEYEITDTFYIRPYRNW